MDKLYATLEKAVNDPVMRPTFYEILMKSEVFVITDSRKLPIEDGILKAPTNVAFVTWRKKDDTPIVPFFSSIEQLRRGIQEKVSYLQLNCKDLFFIIAGGYAVLNPYSEHSKEFVPEEIEALINGTVFIQGTSIVNEKDTKVLIGEPAVYPQKVVDVLTAYFKKDARIKKAYIVQWFNPNEENPPHPLVVIECGEEAYLDISGKAGMVARTVLDQGEYIDIIRAGSSSFTDNIISEYQPFYKRKWLGLF